MDAERLERAAAFVLREAEADRSISFDELKDYHLVPVAVMSELRAALAAPEPAQADRETDIEWLLRQMETQDLATLRGIAKSFPCERNGCSPDKSAQAGEAVAWPDPLKAMNEAMTFPLGDAWFSINQAQRDSWIKCVARAVEIQQRNDKAAVAPSRPGGA